MAVYHVFCNGREFGLDYGRTAAISTAAAYRALWPHNRYYARKVTGGN